MVVLFTSFIQTITLCGVLVLGISLGRTYGRDLFWYVLFSLTTLLTLLSLIVTIATAGLVFK